MCLSMFEAMKPTKQNLSFVLTFISIIGLLTLAFYKGVDISMSLPAVLGIYVGARAGQKSLAIYAASKDENADTHAVIRDLEGASKKVDSPE